MESSNFNRSGRVLTSLELGAYAKTVYAVALIVHDSVSFDELPTVNESNLPPPYFYTWHSSLNERSAGFLWKLKILKSLDKENERRGVFFKFDCDLADVPAIAIKNAASGPTLDSLVWLYLELRSEYTRMHLDQSTLFFRDGKPTFSIREEEIAVFEALEPLGYVQATQGGYACTAKTETLLSKPWWDE
jgi:hypothetical protein